jgi:branched-chain amino acid transport system substrate-binding protein
MSPSRIALVLAASALAGCSTQTPPPVTVGHVATQSNRDDGGPAARAIRLAVQQANRDIDKETTRPIKVIHTDTLGKLGAFEAEAVRLVKVNRALALLGGTTPEEVERLETVAVPLVSPCGVRPRSRSEHVFCTGLSPAYRGIVLARFAADELDARHAVVLADPEREEHTLLAEAFAQEFPSAVKKKDAKPTPLTLPSPPSEGGEGRVRGVARPPVVRYSKEASFRDLVGLLKDDRKSVVLLAGPAGDLRRLRKELTDSKLLVLFGGPEDSLRALTEQTESGAVWVATAFAADLDEARARAFVKEYRELYKDDPDVDAALAYDGARLLFEAVRRAKEGLTGARVRDELTQIKRFPGLTGSVSFGEDRRLRRPALVVRLDGSRPRVVKRYGPEG